MKTSFATEILKLRKRPAIWLMCLIFLAFLIVFGYVFSYQLVEAQRSSASQGQLGVSNIAESTLQSILPEAVAYNLILQIYTFGGAVALIIGALAVGSEYSWDTLKTSFTQRAQRLTIFCSMALALSLVFVILVFASLVAAGLSSYAVASFEEEPSNWPSIGTMLEALGAAWLILAAWGALGTFLATLFRGTALAIGLGLVYSLVLENFLWSLQFQNEILSSLQDLLLVQNSSNLVDAFYTGNLPPGTPTPDPTHALLVIAAYFVGFIALSSLVLSQRDVI